MSITDWGTITVGRLTLREVFELDANIDASTGLRSMTLRGQESMPPLTLAQLRGRQEDILGLKGRFVQIAFTNKPDHDGYYRIEDASAGQVNWTGEVAIVPWSIRATYLGPANGVDIEARLTAVDRADDFGLTGEFWHAPNVGAEAYYTGSTLPAGTVNRTGEDGVVVVFRDVPSTINPRWASAVSDYPLGRCRIEVDGLERVSVNALIPASASWSLENSLVQVTPGASSTLVVSSWGGSDWEDVGWNLTVAGSSLAASAANVSVLRNDFEMTTVRAVWERATGSDRVTVDLTLRRGSRFAEGYAQAGAATTLGLARSAAEAGTAPASAGYLVASADDADGNRYIVGSARTFTADTVNGSISKSASRTLDFWVGSVVAGSAAVAGDQAADLRDQYLTASAEMTTGVKR